MPDENPNLIPPPSIGESKPAPSDVAVAKPKRSKLWIVVLICVVAGIALGVFVYQQSIAPAPTPSRKPVATPKASLAPSLTPSPTASASAETPGINAVTPQSNTVTFPKAGEVRVYFGGYGANPTVANHLIRLTTATGEADVVMPSSVAAGAKMVSRDSGLEVSAGQTVTIASYDRGNMSQPSYGWMPPNAANKCDVTYATDVAPMVAWATQQANGEPLVSKQCWADWNQPNDPTPRSYNDFFIILSYKPASAAAATTSPSPSPSPSPAASKSPSPSPSALASKSPSPSPSSAGTTTASPSSAARVTMPEGSALPDAGVFEVTAGTMGIALVFILLGILGLLLI